MKQTFLLLPILFFLSSNLSFAQQQGYILTLKGDTIRCQVKNTHSFLTSTIKYSIGTNGDFKKISTDSIREYQLSNDCSVYLLQYLHDRSTYIKRLKHGKISLYQEMVYKHNYQGQYSSYDLYITKGDNALILLPDDKQELRTFFINLISDNSDLLVAFRVKNDVSEANIKSYIDKYNSIP